MKNESYNDFKKAAKFHLILSYVFLGLSLVSLVFSICSHFICCIYRFKEMFYWCCAGFGTLCLCSLPMMSFFNKKEEKEESRERVEAQTTTKVLNSIAELMLTKEWAIVTKTTYSFCNKINAIQICDAFHEYNTNKLFVNDFENCVKAYISQQSLVDDKQLPFKENSWEAIFVNCVFENWFLYKDKDNLFTKPHQKFDEVIRSLVYVLNRLEVISYQFLDMKVNKKVFIEEIFHVIDRVYIYSFYVLFKTNLHTSFPKIDSMCRLIYLEK